MMQAPRALTPAGWQSVRASVADGRLVDLEVAPAEDDGRWVVPGLVDLQVNGGWGIDLVSEPDGLWELASRLPAVGVTAFLPTLVSCSPGTVDRALDVLAAGPPAGWVGARPLGWHLEGPFLAPSRRGVHDAAAIRAPDPDLLERWVATRGVAMVTLAPELAGADDCIRVARAAGVVVSAGHSDATYEEALHAFATGVTAVTHLGNAMSGLHHRAPGLVGAALTTPGVVVGIVADGHHLHPGMLALVEATAGDRVALVTDAVAAAGLSPGRHHLGGRDDDGPRSAARRRGQARRQHPGPATSTGGLGRGNRRRPRCGRACRHDGPCHAARPPRPRAPGERGRGRLVRAGGRRRGGHHRRGWAGRGRERRVSLEDEIHA